MLSKIERTKKERKKKKENKIAKWT